MGDRPIGHRQELGPSDTERQLHPLDLERLRVVAVSRSARRRLDCQRLPADVVAKRALAQQRLQLVGALVRDDDAVRNVQPSGPPHVLDAVHQLSREPLLPELRRDGGADAHEVATVQHPRDAAIRRRRNLNVLRRKLEGADGYCFARQHPARDRRPVGLRESPLQLRQPVRVLRPDN